MAAVSIKTKLQRYVEESVNEHQISNQEHKKTLVEYADFCSIGEFEQADALRSAAPEPLNTAMSDFRTKFDKWRWNFD